MYTTEKYLFDCKNLVSNPSARVPVCLCLDVSGSMDGLPIQELNEGVHQFYQAIKEDETALYAADICVISFGGTEPVCLRDFSGLDQQPEVPTLSAGGMTPMGEAINLGLDLLERRKEQFRSVGVDYFQPWFVLMSDGAPNGAADQLARAKQRMDSLARDKKLSVFPIGIGAHADMKALAEFSPMRSPLKLKGLKFREFFEWLSQSVSTTSQSIAGESISLDFEGIKGWAEL